MDLGLQEETGKDKRLLVLLAFGMLFLLVRVPSLFQDRGVPPRSWTWLEGEGESGGPRRVVIDGNRAPNTLLPETGHGGSISPRLAFLLGRPLAVNQATTEELALLEGIGPKLALGIVDHRQQNGRIDNIAELLEVPGIGKQLAERLAPQLSFD